MKSKEEIIIQAKTYAKSIGDEDGTSAYDYVMGYNKCQEDMADKKYTEEDVIKAIEMAREGIRVTRISEWETEKEFDYNDYQIINSLNKQD